MMRSKTCAAAVLLNVLLATSALATEACLRPVVEAGAVPFRGPVSMLVGAPGGGDAVLAGTSRGLFRVDGAGNASPVAGTEGRSVGPGTSVPWRNEVALWIAGEGLATVGRSGVLQPLRAGPCGSPLTCHLQAARQLVGPALLDAALQPDRLQAISSDQEIAVWRAGSEIAQRVTIERGLPALVGPRRSSEMPIGAPVTLPGTDTVYWVGQDRIGVSRPNGSLSIVYSGPRASTASPPQVIELPRSRMLLITTDRDWMSVAGTAVRTGIAPFNAPLPAITAVSDRGPQGGVWIGSSRGVVHVATADLLRSRVQSVGRKPLAVPAVLTAPADGGEPQMGAVTALEDLTSGRLLVGASGGLFVVSQDGAAITRHRPFIETGRVRSFRRWFATGAGSAEDQPILMEAEAGFFVVDPGGAVTPVPGSNAVQGGIAQAPGTSRLFLNSRDGAALLEVVVAPGIAAAAGTGCRH